MQNSNFYKRFDDKKSKLEYTYVWNNLDSMDSILQGWIPHRLVNILKCYMKKESKKFIKNLLIKWLGKVDSFFFELIWKKRNDDMIIWEENHGINKNQKRNITSKNAFDLKQKLEMITNDFLVVEKKLQFMYSMKVCIHKLEIFLDFLD